MTKPGIPDTESAGEGRVHMIVKILSTYVKAEHVVCCEDIDWSFHRRPWWVRSSFGWTCLIQFRLDAVIKRDNEIIAYLFGFQFVLPLYTYTILCLVTSELDIDSSFMPLALYCFCCGHLVYFGTLRGLSCNGTPHTSQKKQLLLQWWHRPVRSCTWLSPESTT